MKLWKKTAAYTLAVLLCLASLTTGAGMETEKDIFPDALSEGEKDAGTKEAGEERSLDPGSGYSEDSNPGASDTEREDMPDEGKAVTEDKILAGPVELNDLFEETIPDESPDEMGDTGGGENTGEGNAVDAMPDLLPDKKADQQHVRPGETPDGSEDGPEAGTVETEEEVPLSKALRKKEYLYEDSMTFRELARLPKDEAGAATEVKRMFSPGGLDGMVLSAASEETSLWTCSDYYVNETDMYHVEKKDDFSLKYQIEFHTSTALDAESVEIRIPEALLTDRRLGKVTPSQIGIPRGTREAPSESLNSPFNWYRDEADGSLVFFNYRAIASGTNTAFQVLYHPVLILDLVDGSTWSLKPVIRVALRSGQVQTETMQELSGRIDSKALLVSSSAGAYTDGSIGCLPALYTKDQVRRILGGNLPSHVSGEDGEWLYIAWQIDYQGEFNQPWGMTIDSSLSATGTSGSDNSCVVGSITKITGTAEGSSPSGSIVKRYIAAEGSTILTELTSRDLSAYQDKGLFHLTTTAVTAVRRSSLRDNGSVLGLSASLELTPEDGIDAPSRSAASASWTFVDYKWKYKGDDVGIFAWTGQMAPDGSVSYNSRNVSLSGWVNEYRLSLQTGDPAGAVPMRILSECRGYSHTHETGGPAAGSYRAGTGYEVTTVDDVVYLASLGDGEDSGLRLLSSQDYYYSEIRVTIKDRGMDIYEDRVCAPMSDAECPGADRSTKIYVMYAGSSEWQFAAECPWDGSGKVTYIFPKSALANRIWRVKVVHRAVDYDSSCTIDTKLCIRPDSPVCGSLLAGTDEDNAVYLKAEHLGSVLARSIGGASAGWFHDSDSSHYDGSEPGLAGLTMDLYGIYSMRANSFAELTSMKKHARALKKVSWENDPANGRIRLTCRIGALEGYRIYSRDAALRIASGNTNLPVPDRTEYVIYDLLPEGVTFDPSVPVTAGLVMGDTDRDLVTPSLWNSRDVSVRIDPETGVVRNWKHTGRDLVILDVRILLGEERIPRLTDGMWMNGIGVQFGASCSYRDLKRMKLMPNIAAVMPGYGRGDPAEQILGSDEETACDDGIAVPFTGKEKEDLEVFGADIDDDGVTNLRTILYARAGFEGDTAVSLTDGIRVMVRSDKEAYADWEESAITGPGDPYTYRIDVTNSSSQPVSELVIACHLERGSEERQLAESDRVFDSLTWQGFLEEVDTEALRRAGIAPVIWLNADPDAVFPGEGCPPDSVLTPQSGWVRLEDWTGEMASVRSVAVDLRRKTDGSSFILEMGGSVYILLHMKAPEIGDGEGETFSEHAYHCASFYSISQDEPDGDLVEADAVEVTLKERTVLIVEKELTNEESDSKKKKSFLFRLMRGGQAVPLGEYRLEERREDGTGPLEWTDDGNLHTTGRDGLFSLMTGQRAVFENEAGGDGLSAMEIRPACYEEVIQEEYTDEGRICRFENTWYPTLYLTKKVFGAPEGTDLSADIFRVRVTADGRSMVGMPYWTVDRTGGYVEDEVLEEHTVDDDSCVLLHSDEVIALHPGDANCFFEIEEEESCYGEGTDYAGVTLKKSGQLGPEGLSVTLENAWRWKELAIRKEILHQGMHESSETFSFRLWKMHEGADAASFDPENPSQTADPVPGIRGRMGQVTFQTDENGCFSAACAGREVVLEHLEALGSYVVQETDIPDDYEAVNGGLVSAVMPLLAERKTINIQNVWKKRSLEVSKAVLSGTHRKRTTVFSPGYPALIASGSSPVDLFSCSRQDMTGFTVTFPVSIQLQGTERIRVRSGSHDIDSFSGTIAAGTSRTYSGYSQVSFQLWGISRNLENGFFFYFSPDTGESSAGEDMSGKSFSFLLETEDENGSLKPAPNTPYLTSEGETLQTDEGGFFILQAGMTATFADLASEGAMWRVTETQDPSCGQVYPSGGEAWSGRLGENGEDLTHALFVNGVQCQGLFRKQFTSAWDDEAALAYLQEERAKGTASSLKAIFLIETENGSGSYAPMEGEVRVADAATGDLLSCELYQGRICLSENQTVVLDGIGQGGSFRITETNSGFYKNGTIFLKAVCTVPGENSPVVIRPGNEVEDKVFINELRSVDTAQQSLICKEFLSGSKGWEKVPDGAVLAFCLERYENGFWHPAEGVNWIQCLDQVPMGNEMNRTGADGIIRVTKESASGKASSGSRPVLPIAIADGNVKTQLYYTEHEAQEKDLRIREAPDLSDPSFGMLTGCEGNTFINENEMQELVIEKQTDVKSGQSFSMKIEQRFGDQSLPGRYLTYRTRDASTLEIIGSGKTDEQGGFSLKGNTQAVFTLAAGTRWEVTEKSSGNWNLVSCTMEHPLSDPEYTQRGILFDMAPVRHNATLTEQMLSESLSDPLSGQPLDFTSRDLIIPHYVRRGEEILEITGIDNWLFSGSDLRSVTIEDGIRKIGAGAFFDCEGLVSIRLPQTLEELGETCFYYTAVSTLEFPSSVRSVGEGITAECYNLQHIIIHQNEAQSPFSGYEWYTGTDTTVEFTG